VANQSASRVRRPSKASSDAAAQFDLMTAPGHLIRRAQQIHFAIWGQRIPESVTSVQFATLALLIRQPDIDQRTVGELLSIDTSTLAEVCSRLADRGLIERHRDKVDRRRYVLRVTPRAEELVESVVPLVEEVGDELLAPFTASERTMLLKLLRKLLLHHQPDTDSQVLRAPQLKPKRAQPRR
jgi:DNA-binding MarR family transcriptional regulator